MSKEKDALVNKACAKASLPLIAVFYTLELEEYVTATVVNKVNGDKFELTLKKL